jgi:3D (Asp-Asp-Asp) domain-containing protein
VFVTYYGYPDNDPPGRAIAYPASREARTIHNEAGGTGSYSDPVTFASAEEYLAVGSRIYLPYIQKYAIKEDLCANCGWDHVDVWMESDASHEAELYACQGRFTKKITAIEVDPPAGRGVDTRLLFNPSTGDCRVGDNS